MEFVTFTVINPRGDRMHFCLEARKADIIIEKCINMGMCKVQIND